MTTMPAALTLRPSTAVSSSGTNPSTAKKAKLQQNMAMVATGRPGRMVSVPLGMIRRTAAAASTAPATASTIPAGPPSVGPATTASSPARSSSDGAVTPRSGCSADGRSSPRFGPAKTMATASGSSDAVNAHLQPTVARASEPTAGPAAAGISQASWPSARTFGRSAPAYSTATLLIAIASRADAPAPSRNLAATSSVICWASPAPRAPQANSTAPAWHHDPRSPAVEQPHRDRRRPDAGQRRHRQRQAVQPDPADVAHDGRQTA